MGRILNVSHNRWNASFHHKVLSQAKLEASTSKRVRNILEKELKGVTHYDCMIKVNIL